MRQLAIIILSLFTIVQPGSGQPSELFTKTWKMEKVTSVAAGNTYTIFHKDSASNNLNYNNLKYNFFINGTYTLLSDTSSSQGTWALNVAGDSVVIDMIPYSLIELSATHFTTRGFSLQIADTVGTIDTSYTYVVLYPTAPLPVKLLRFTGKYTANGVQLNWSTAQEQQNKEFQVQYSPNGTSFETIGTVPAKGNSTTETGYVFRTSRYQTGKNFYRLKQVDMDGHTTLSPVVVISLDASRQSIISLSPNPASNKLNLIISQPVAAGLQLVLTTVAGQQVWSTMLPGNTTGTTVYLPVLTKGVYIAYVINNKGERIFYNKLVIQ